MTRRPARRYYGTARNAPTRPVQRRPSALRGLRRLLLGLGAALLACWAADRTWLQLSTAPVFEVRRVELRGLRNAEPSSLRAAAALEGCNVFTLDLSAARERLLAHPWTLDARLRRSLPDAVVIEVDERVPAALERRDGALVLLDEQAGVLEDDAAPGRFELPMLEGVGTPRARMRAVLVLAELRARAPELWTRVESIDVSRPDRLVLRAAGQPPIWLAGPESVDELMRWLSSAESLERLYGRPAHVDARWRDRLYLGRS